MKINAEQFVDHFEEFKTAANELLPILCFSPDETEGFIAQFSELNDHTVCKIEHADGQATFYRYVTNTGMGGRVIQYILPSKWGSRYDLLREALTEIKADFLENCEQHILLFRIKEDIPSHNSYFLGLLPEFGFNINPRISMMAETELVSQLELPELATDIVEIPYKEEQLPDFIDLYHHANNVHLHAPKLSDKERAQQNQQNKMRQAEYITSEFENESVSTSCTGLTQNGKIIGFSFGEVWDGKLSINEVGILPEFYGQGLGRYLTIRCMQKLYANFNEPGRFFAIGTNRTNARALKLYHRLGFQIDTIESDAVLVNPTLLK